MNTNQIRSKIAELQAEAKGFNGRQEYSETDLSRIVAIGDEVKGLEAQLATAEKAERVLSEAKGFAERESAVRPLDVAPAAKADRKSFGAQFMASPSAKVKGVESQLNVDVKTLMTTTTGYPYPSAGNQGVIVYQPTPATTLLDALDVIPANPGTGYRYFAETVYTNNADTIPEGGLYPESALKLEERTAGIYKVGTWIPVTDEQLSDVPGAEAYIDSRLRRMVRGKAGAKIMSGSGTNDVLGIMNTPGVLTRARGTDTVLDAIQYAMAQVSDVGSNQEDFDGAKVNLIVMNPSDWAKLRTAKAAGSGTYLLGDPAAAGIQQVWDVPVVLDKGMAAGTLLALDTDFFKVLLGSDVSVQQTNSHADFFINGKNAVRAQIRLGAVAIRPSAAITVTGLNAA